MAEAYSSTVKSAANKPTRNYSLTLIMPFLQETDETEISILASYKYKNSFSLLFYIFLYQFEGVYKEQSIICFISKD